MIALALCTPLVAILAMLGLARIEDGLDLLMGRGQYAPAKTATRAGVVRLRRSGHRWAARPVPAPVAGARWTAAALAPSERWSREQSPVAGQAVGDAAR